ncbi:hypothetical protein R3P38DRAFT_2542898, partial [Favolaschia claudopus]
MPSVLFYLLINLFSRSERPPQTYVGFFDALKHQLPTLSYDAHYRPSEFSSLASSSKYASAVDDLLMQPPPSGHPLFSSPTTTMNNDSPPPSFNDYSAELLSTPPPPSKRKAPPTDPLDSPAPRAALPKRVKLSSEEYEKLDRVFDLFQELDWTLGDFLHYTFTHKDSNNIHIARSQRHGNIVQRYLSGQTSHGVGRLLESWFTSPDGRAVDDEDLFNTETPYRDINQVRIALTAFAAQTCGDELGKEARAAVEKSGGLHTRNDEVEWQDLGDAIQQAKQSLRIIQRLTFHFMSIVAEPTPRSRSGIIDIRKSRPRDNVVIHCLSMLDFCKNSEARLLPLANGILYLSSLVPNDIVAFNSRLAAMPAVNTIKAALKDFSKQKAVSIRSRGRDVAVSVGTDGRLYTLADILTFDNTQHFARQ